MKRRNPKLRSPSRGHKKNTLNSRTRTVSSSTCTKSWLNPIRIFTKAIGVRSTPSCRARLIVIMELLERFWKATSSRAVTWIESKKDSSEASQSLTRTLTTRAMMTMPTTTTTFRISRRWSVSKLEVAATCALAAAPASPTSALQQMPLAMSTQATSEMPEAIASSSPKSLDDNRVKLLTPMRRTTASITLVSWWITLPTRKPDGTSIIERLWRGEMIRKIRCSSYSRVKLAKIAMWSRST